MPDYEIKEWNEDNFDVNAIPFVKQAYEEKKWAFVADVCRFYACYTEGGIYLDTDVEVFRRFDRFLDNSFFIGIEYQENAEVYRLGVDASVFGCEKGNGFARECLDYYNDKAFRLEDGRITGGTVQAISSIIAEKYGFRRVDENQVLNNGVNVFSTKYFCNISNKIDKKTIYSLHHFDGSWVDYSDRGIFYRFCRRHDMLHVYKGLEKLVQKLK